MQTRLLAIGLELPEEAFVNMHDFNAVGETYGMPHSPVALLTIFILLFQ